MLVSEVMLQQTRVETVIPYFERFLSRFPEPADLAAADDDELLALWSGLGYYRRARFLKRAAQQIVDEHQGRFPRGLDEILALPGVGRYTAGAVASIALGQAVPLVDGNAARLLSRVFALDADLTTSRGTRELWATAERLVDERRPGDLNQALMELGATRCSPTTPDCERCPLERACRARNEGTIDRFPPPRRKSKPIPVRLAAVVLRRGDQLACVRRRTGTLMEGLLDIPSIELPTDADARRALTVWLRARFGRRVGAVEHVATVRHSITRHRLQVDVHAAVDRGELRSTHVKETPPDDGGPHRLAPVADDGGLRFVDADAFLDQGVSSLARKIAGAVGARRRPGSTP